MPGDAAAPKRVAGAILLNLLIVAVLGLMLFFFRPQLYASMRVLVDGLLAAGSIHSLRHTSPVMR